MFIMVHEFQLSVGGRVYLGETWALTTGSQQCGEDSVIVGNSLPLARLIRLNMDYNCD